MYLEVLPFTTAWQNTVSGKSESSELLPPLFFMLLLLGQLIYLPVFPLNESLFIVNKRILI